MNIPIEAKILWVLAAICLLAGGVALYFGHLLGIIGLFTGTLSLLVGFDEL